MTAGTGPVRGRAGTRRPGRYAQASSLAPDTAGRFRHRRSDTTSRSRTARRSPEPEPAGPPRRGTRTASDGEARRASRGRRRRRPRPRPPRPSRVDGVVDVTHRIELVGPDLELEPSQRWPVGRDLANPDRAERPLRHGEHRGEDRRDPGRCPVEGRQRPVDGEGGGRLAGVRPELGPASGDHLAGGDGLGRADELARRRPPGRGPRDRRPGPATPDLAPGTTPGRIRAGRSGTRRGRRRSGGGPRYG